MKMNKKLLVMTDMDFKGSGYYYLMSPTLHRLAKLGYDIKVIGLGYTGEEHYYDFTIIPCASPQDGIAIIQNLVQLWYPDLFICALDIPMQIAISSAIKKHGLKYMAITPMENPPLTPSWTASLMGLDYVFFISELGKLEAQKAGLTKVDHLVVGIDSESFYPALGGERQKLRDDLGYEEDEFVILTVADNQERKNLWAAIRILSNLKQAGHKVRYVLVTREQSQVGYKLRDLCMRYDVNKETLIIERGIPQEELRKLYISSDLFLLPSKAEGLGIPILEAMACGCPVMGTQTGAITELLSYNRGFLVPPEYEFVDVWGNSQRAMIDIRVATDMVEDIMSHTPATPTHALMYIESRTLDYPVTQMDKVIQELLDENK